MIVVLDVSAAIEIILQKSKKDLFYNEFKNANWVIAPDLFVSEITNVLWKYYRAQLLTHDECNQYVDDGIKMVDDFMDAKDIWKEALSEGIKNNHSIYDMYYAILTRRNDAKLLTNDGPLAELCRILNISVIN